MKRTVACVLGVIVAVVVLLAAGIISGVPALQPGILVVVKNSDLGPISGVQVLLGGERVDLGAIASGDSMRRLMAPSTDSNIIIRYLDGSGAPQTIQMDEYVTSGYRGRVDIEVQPGALASSTTSF